MYQYGGRMKSEIRIQNLSRNVTGRFAIKTDAASLTARPDVRERLANPRLAAWGTWAEMGGRALCPPPARSWPAGQR